MRQYSSSEHDIIALLTGFTLFTKFNREFDRLHRKLNRLQRKCYQTWRHAHHTPTNIKQKA